MTDPSQAPAQILPSEPTSADPRVAELERRLAEQAQSHQTRLAIADLKLHAIRAGMIDLDGIKLIDQSQIRLTEAGEVDGADRLMTNLRRDKPWLFQAVTTSTLAPAPPVTSPTAKRATEMTHAEWQSARAALLKRR